MKNKSIFFTLGIAILFFNILIAAFPLKGNSTSQSQNSETDTLDEPCLPSTYYEYANQALPQHYTVNNGPGSVSAQDNTPIDNPVTNAGATLGRVLFYDARLSVNNTIACASCHHQEFGFADTAVLSIGFNGGTTARHSMSLSNARYYLRGHFFWDERANTLEDQTITPIQDPVEMGMTLGELETKLAATTFYPALFEDAFGDTAVTSDRISKALSQFVRSMISYRSKYDSAFGNGPPDFAGTFTTQELRGLELFGQGPNSSNESLRCDQCHGGQAHISNNIENNGLDAVTTDVGAGNGRFKSPSLRNVGVRGRFMHDGRFSSLEEVVDFYSDSIQNHPNLSPLLRVGDQPNGQAEDFNLSATDKAALVAFLHTLTDNAFLTDEKFSDPFCKQSTTSVQSFLEADNIRMFPNPFNNYVRLRGAEGKMIAYRAYDVSGRLVKNGTAYYTHDLSIPTSDLRPGLYFFEVRDTENGELQTFSLVKQ